jgi:thioredoxin reductase (NADPH)
MAPHRKPQVVIVDDEPGVGSSLDRVVRRALASQAPRVHVAEGPEEALFLLDSLPVDAGPVLVIADHNMHATKDGVDLLREVGARRPGARRVLISACDRRDFEHRFPEVGLDAFVAKPWDLAELSALLVRLVGDGGQPGPGAVTY